MEPVRPEQGHPVRHVLGEAHDTQAPGGSHVHVADIGDDGRRRDAVRVVRGLRRRLLAQALPLGALAAQRRHATAVSARAPRRAVPLTGASLRSRSRLAAPPFGVQGQGPDRLANVPADAAACLGASLEPLPRGEDFTGDQRDKLRMPVEREDLSLADPHHRPRRLGQLERLHVAETARRRRPHPEGPDGERRRAGRPLGRLALVRTPHSNRSSDNQQAEFSSARSTLKAAGACVLSESRCAGSESAAATSK